LIVPTTQFVTAAFARAVVELHESGFPVWFIDELPEGICDNQDTAPEQALLEKLRACPVVPLDGVVERLLEKHFQDLSIVPASRWIRSLHYQYAEGGELYYFVNEGTEIYQGVVHLPSAGPCYAYNAWDNRLETVNAQPDTEGTQIAVEIEPLKSLLIVFNSNFTGANTAEPVKAAGERVALNHGWTRSICPGIAYPDFQQPKAVTLPDRLAQEQPKFSGFVRYEREFQLNKLGRVVLEITDAHEGVEVFVNSQSAGIQIVPPFRYEITHLVKQGRNDLRIEVATTLERQVGRRGLRGWLLTPKPSALSGITGEVNLCVEVTIPSL
jgi:hypothetical protein